MKKLTLLAVFAASAVTLSGAVVAEWDFSKSLNTADGKFEFKPRVADLVKITPEGADFSYPVKADTDAGIVSVKRYSELTPAGAFEIAITFKPDMEAYYPKTKNKYSVLWDNKYYYYHKTDKPAYHGGMIVRANISNGNIGATVYLGLGDHTEMIDGFWTKTDGKTFHTLKVKYDPAAGTLSFTWDNKKPVVRKVKKPAPLTMASYNLVIGDRYSSTRSPFKGVISKIVLSSVDTASAAENK